MDHGSHGGHTGHGSMEPMCNMNMLFTWDPTDLCIIFRSWHVRSTASLIFSLMAVAALTAGYELVREISRRYETAADREVERDNDDERRLPMWLGRGSVTARRGSKTIKAALYAVQVFYSFFIMLLFMTYNGWVMLAVAVGAFVGYMAFGNASPTKTVACH